MSAQTIQVNPVFNIQLPDIHFPSTRLVVEAGPMGISMVLLDDSNCFIAVVSYAFSQTQTVTSLGEKMEEIFSSEKLFAQSYKRTDIIWAFRESMMVPSDYLNSDLNEDMLNLVFGDAGNYSVKTDFLFNHNLHNLHRIPQDLMDLFIRQFPQAVYTHQYSLLPDLVDKHGDQVLCVIYNNCMTVILCKAGKLQFISNFDYQQPADAAYNLISVVEHFNATPAETVLHLYGMITVDSPLYSELYKYFLKIQFGTLPSTTEYIDSLRDQPNHYFSHLFSLATCV